MVQQEEIRGLFEAEGKSEGENAPKRGEVAVYGRNAMGAGVGGD